MTKKNLEKLIEGLGKLMDRVNADKDGKHLPDRLIGAVLGERTAKPDKVGMRYVRIGNDR